MKLIWLSQKGLIFHVLSSFFYGFFNWFRPYDAWFLGSKSNRVLIDGKYYDRLFDYPASKLNRSLVIELSTNKHYKRKKVASKRIVSRSTLIIIEKFYSLFLFSKAKNLQIFDQIKLEHEIDFDPSYAIKKMVSQYKVMKFLLFFNKPKYVFIAPAFTAYGYVKAFKEKGIKVIEIQHGVISNQHYGYNVFSNFNDEYSPDYLLSLGENERKVFVPENTYIDSELVIPVGSYYIEHINNTFKPSIEIIDLSANYKLVFSVSLQDCVSGSKLVPFLVDAARKNSSFLYLVKPRRTSIETYSERYDLPDNFVLIENLNVYQTILHSDIHITAFSSCALEAPALGKKNILINIDGKAVQYYKDILINSNTTVYVDDYTEFENEVNQMHIQESEFVKSEHKDVLVSNYSEKVDEFLIKLE